MPVSPNAIPPTGPVSIAMLNAEFGLGNNLNAYKGIRMYNTANNSRRDIGTGSNAYVPMGDFRGYQATSPVVAGSRAYLTTQTDTLPLFNVMTITVWGGGGGGGGGAITNAIYDRGADGNPGTDGDASSVVNSSNATNYANAVGGGGGGGGQRANRPYSNGADGAGYDGAYGEYGAGGAAANNDGGTGATPGGRGGYGGKTVVVWNVDSDPSLLSRQLQNVNITVGAGGAKGTGNQICWPAYPYICQTGNSGADGSVGRVNISWT